MKKKLDLWEIASRFFVVVQFIVILVSLNYTEKQIKNSQNATYMEYMFKFDSEFSENINHKIALDIENNKPVLRNHGGSRSEDDLDAYLGIYEDLYKALQMDLISKDLIYNDFVDDLVLSYQDKEIKDYIVKSQKEDPDYFTGFQTLGKMFENYHPVNK